MIKDINAGSICRRNLREDNGTDCGIAHPYNSCIRFDSSSGWNYQRWTHHDGDRDYDAVQHLYRYCDHGRICLMLKITTIDHIL